jgi:hypothetical protein
VWWMTTMASCHESAAPARLPNLPEYVDDY